MNRLLELKETLRQLKDPLSFLEGVFAFAPVALQVFSTDGKSLITNDAYRKLFGMVPPTLRFHAETLQKAFEGETVQFPVQRHQNGVTFESQAFSVQGSNEDSRYVIFCYKDVTKENLYHDQLTRNQSLWEEVENFSQIGNWIAGLDPSEPLIWSTQTYRLFGVDENETDLRGADFFTFLHPEDHQKIQLAGEQALLTEVPQTVEHRIILRNGKTRWLRERIEVMKDQDGKVRKLFGLCQDITDAKAKERTLQITQERFFRLFEAEVIGVMVSHTDGRITEANDTFLKILGYSREELVEGLLNWERLTPPKFAELDQDALKELRETGRFSPFQKEYIRKDGSRVPVLITGALVQSRETEVLTLAFDMTEMLELETKFMQAQKMEAMGRFAGGIAHDFNNILGVILLHSAEALEHISQDSSVSSSLIAIKKAAERAAGLTRQILAFSRKQVLETKDIDLNHVVADMEQMIRRVIGEDVHFSAHQSPSPAVIRADQSQLEQTILNLVINAKDAMPQGGKLRVEIEPCTLDLRAISATGVQLKPGDYVSLSVSDNGQGIPEDLLTHIFEPFFTTKETGKGTGLGLSTVFGVVRQTGGDVSVLTKVDHGTRFTLYFPRSKTTPYRPVAAKEVSEKLEGGQRTILLVEDEEPLREAISELLKRKGFIVIEAGNGKEALEKFKKAPTVVGLIVTDVIMPEMTGPKLVQTISEYAPENRVQVLYLSGYSAGELERFGIDEATSSFLEKPFTPGNLVKKIAEIFNRSTPPKA